MDSVKITVLCPLSGIIIYECYTTKELLCISPLFQAWFRGIDRFKDYIEIGNQGYSGVSNLMLFYKKDNGYLLTINCKYFTHILGRGDPPNIKKVIDYLNVKIEESDEFKECKELFKI